MMLVRALSLTLALASAHLVFGHEYKLKERVAVPRGWSRVGSAPSDHNIELRIGLQQSDFETLEQHLLEVSDPTHARYGQHLTKEQVEAHVAPHPNTLNAVESWLESHGFDLEADALRSPAKDWITLSVPVRVAEQLLNTTYSVWNHVSGDNIVRTTYYNLPEHLHEHIDVIQPTTSFGLFKPQRITSFIEEDAPVLVDTTTQVLSSANTTVNASCNSTITPQCLYQLYNINYNGSFSTGNSIATANYLEEFENFTDLRIFYQKYVPAAVNNPVTVHLINGGINNQSDPGGEAALDADYAFGLSYPAKNIFYSTGGRPPFTVTNASATDNNEPYQQFLDFILGQSKKDMPLIVTTSYGDEEGSVPESYAKRVCSGFAQLGARGVTVFFSSGDGGVGDGEQDPSETDCPTRFLPTFPSTCPYVTSVGGTRYINEIGVDFSGGGFSNYFPRPIWQELAVAQAKAHIPAGVYKGLYNSGGRAFPDISAQSVRFAVNIQGKFYGISGTSASTPATAGIFAKLNDLRLKSRLPPLGFISPLLYAGLGFGFNDIKAGNNPVSCGTPGFNATPGYDLVTGLGTPNFPQLKVLTSGPFGL